MVLGTPGTPVPVLPMPPMPPTFLSASAAFFAREAILYSPAANAPPASTEPMPSRALNFSYSWLTMLRAMLPTELISSPFFRVLSSKSTSSFKAFTKPLRPAAGPPPPVPLPPSIMVSCKASHELFRSSMSPARLSFLILFTFSAKPSAVSTALASL